MSDETTIGLTLGGSQLTIVAKKGDRGDDGAPGPSGLDGKDGAPGPKGSDGKDGKDGKDGAPGPKGPKGDAGKDGADGKDGSPDDGQAIAGKLNALRGVVDYGVLKNVPVAHGIHRGGGASTFLSLTDTPSSYTGQAGKAAVVNGAETGLEFAVATSTDEKAKVSANDTTAGYLNGKLVGGTYVTLTEANDGANETLSIDPDWTTAVPAYETDPFYSANTYAVGMNQDVDSGASVTFDQLSITGQLAAINGAPLSWPGANASGQLTNDGSGNLSWATGVTGATDATLTLTGTTLGINLANANTWTARQTFDALTGADIVLNGGFASGASWSAPAGWSISGGVATHGSNGTGALAQNAGSGPTSGTSYVLTFTILNLTVGSVTPSMGGVTFTARSANGTYTETFTAASSAQIAFAPTNTSRFSVDGVSATPITGGGVLATNSRSADVDYPAATSSPLAWQAAAWKSNSVAASQTTSFESVLRGVTGGTIIKGLWALRGQAHTAALADLLTVSSTGESAVNVQSNLGAVTGLTISAPFGNSTPGTTRHLLLNSTSGYANMEFAHSGTLRQAIINGSGGDMNLYASGGSFFSFYGGNSGLTSNQLFAYLYPTALVHSTGYGAFRDGVHAGLPAAPTSTLQTGGGTALKVKRVTTNQSLDNTATHWLGDATVASCTGTPSVTTCSTYTASGQATCESHLPCVWDAGTSCSVFDNESGMGNCASTSGCTVSTSSCAGTTDQYSCEAQDDAYGGSCTWDPGSNTCSSFTNTTDCNNANPCYATLGGDCTSLSDGGGDGTNCATQPECSYDSGSGACTGTYFTSCDGDNTTPSCSGTYNTGSCTGTFGASCYGTATCTGYVASGTCNAEAGCAWATALTLTLPDGDTCPDRTYWIKNDTSSGADVIIAPFTGQTVEMGTGLTLANYQDAVHLAYYKRTYDCANYVTAGTCTPTGCSITNGTCSYDTGSNLCTGNAVCPANDGNQAACEATTFFQSCSGTEVVYKNWHAYGNS